MKTTGPRRGNVRAACLLLLWSVITCVGVAPVADSAPRERIAELRTEIARHDELYFKKTKPEISDAAYDRLKRELVTLEAAHPEFARPAEGVGDDRSGRFPVHAHRERMLSLNKAYTEAEWRAFHAKLAKQLGRPDLAFVVEPKYDGLAISLTYEHGVLVRAVTRGNGTEGDDVTANVRTIRALPAQLNREAGTLPALVELRGEIYLEQVEFDRINAERAAADEEPFAHPRNLAAGTLKSSDPAETASRRLSVVIYGWGAWEGAPAPVSQQTFHLQVRTWGLPGIARYQLANSADEVWTAVRSIGQKRASLGFPIDGAVVKLNDTALRARVGADEHAPRWAIACKYEPERAVTRLRGITWQVGRTGVLTPVAEFDAVELGGSTVARASLHNRAEIARRDIRIGDLVEVEKAGEIIPAVVGVNLAGRPADSMPCLFPDRCPSCDTTLAEKSDEAAVRCPNTHCPAQRQRRLEHFVSAQAVEIKGIGSATIAALSEAGLLQGSADFYRLRREDLARVPGLGEKTADRLLAEIERSKQAELWRFIHGLGIPQVGAASARKLAAQCGDLAGLARIEAKAAAGVIGPSAAAALAEFMARPENQADIRAMLDAGVRPISPGMAAAAANLQGKVFVFTGTLAGLTRAQAAEKVRAAGGIVRDSVSRLTDYMVAGEGAGSKLAEAQQLGVKVINEEEFRQMVGRP
ncbi:MAG: NAD-dependent DNA ligase LigA [Lacunisphaera sp.]|nr:NAD-dependent DNA ligase LigA [Lacunisphaera sp.]